MEVDWLFFNPDEGGTGSTEVVGSVTDNTAIGVTRYATVRFINEAGQSQTVQITQESNTEGLVFNVTPYVLEFQTAGNVLTGTVMSNSRWFITEYPDWIAITTNSQTTYGDAIYYAKATPNTGNTARSGNIVFTSYGEERYVYVYQPAYTTLVINPSKVTFRGNTGSTSMTVTSSADWFVSSYDTEHIQLSQTSGQSGTTTVTVTLTNLPQDVITYGVSFQTTIKVTDNVTEKELVVQFVGADNIDDKYITVTYNIPTPGTYLAYKYLRCQGCGAWDEVIVDNQTIWAKQEVHSEEVTPDDWEGFPCYEMVYVFYYFGTAGRHTIKYYSNYYGIGFGVFSKVQSIETIVIGDKNDGRIMDFALSQASVKKLILGMGNHYNSNDVFHPFPGIQLNSSLYYPPTWRFYSDSNAFSYIRGPILIIDSNRDAFVPSHNYFSQIKVV